VAVVSNTSAGVEDSALTPAHGVGRKDMKIKRYLD